MKRSIWQRVTALVVSVLIAFPAAFITLTQTASAASRPFTLRYSADLTGDIVFAANTILTCPTSTTCSNVRTGATAGINNNYSMVYVDADADSSTFNSSASSLNLPAGSTVTFAGLYWGAVSSASAASSVKFKVPGATTYTTVTASSFDTIGSVYSAFANVTTSVAAAGNGTFWAADIRATQGSGSHGGWALVVQYSFPGSKTRNCSIFDGLDSVGSGSPKSVTVSGFRTPPAGTVSTKLGVIAYEGDRGTTGDALSLNATVMSDAVNPANDFFNSSLTNGGSHVTGNAPGYLNNLGFDADIVNVSNPGNAVLANNATTAKIDLTSTGDVYYPAVVTFCTELYAPQIV